MQEEQVFCSFGIAAFGLFFFLRPLVKSSDPPKKFIETSTHTTTTTPRSSWAALLGVFD